MIPDVDRCKDPGVTLYGGKNVVVISGGKIRRDSIGTAPLVLADKQNGATARCKVTVQDRPADVIIDDSLIYRLEVGKTLQKQRRSFPEITCW